VKRSAEAELARAVLALLGREPFFAHVLGRVERVFTRSIPTAGVTIGAARLRLLVNPDFLLDELRTRQQRAAVLKHEVLHLVLRHLFRRGVRRDEHRWNVATDLVVNQLIGRPWRLPDSAVTLAAFPGLPGDQTAERYYELLGQGMHADALAATAEAGCHSDHGAWPAYGRGEPGADQDESLGNALVDRLVTEAATRAGTRDDLPGSVIEAIEGAFARSRPQLDWARVVRLFGASSRRTRIRSTHRRPSVRYGTLPGLRIQRLSRLAVAVDTSGSVSTGDLAAFFAEVHGVWRAGTDVHVVECDAAVGRHYPYRGRPPADVSGRGGTAFDPVFEWLRAEGGRWDGCIYLTDGHGPVPAVKPPCPVLWVLTAAGDPVNTRYGRAVRLP
jgi:predicted metal-dependent peptidase